jgi:hypothetical protein
MMTMSVRMGSSVISISELIGARAAGPARPKPVLAGPVTYTLSPAEKRPGCRHPCGTPPRPTRDPALKSAADVGMQAEAAIQPLPKARPGGSEQAQNYSRLPGKETGMPRA